MGIIAESSLSNEVVYKSKETTVTKKKDETTDPIRFGKDYSEKSIEADIEKYNLIKEPEKLI